MWSNKDNVLIACACFVTTKSLQDKKFKEEIGE